MEPLAKAPEEEQVIHKGVYLHDICREPSHVLHEWLQGKPHGHLLAVKTLLLVD